MPLTISNLLAATVVFAVALSGAYASAQKYTPPPPPLTTAPCKPTKKDPCPAPAAATPAPAANAFPFPGEEQQDTAPDAPKPPTITPGGDAKAPPTQTAFPFPGEAAPEVPAAAGANSSSSSSADRAAPDPDQPALKDEGSAGSTRFSRKKLPKVAIVDNDAREAEDLQVSHYYFTTGNFQAAYLRAKDAIATLPEDAAAHLALADSAARLDKAAEAAIEYTACLKLDPTDEQVKAAKKGLAALASAKAPKQAAR